MPNVVNYAEGWQQELIQTFIDNSYIAPFIETDRVRWLDKKTLHFTTMTTGGYKQHSRDGGWNRGQFAQADHPYTLEHDRDVEFYVDEADVDESNKTATVQNISQQFMVTQATPEMDAQFFSKVASTAVANNLFSATATSGWTKDNVVSKLKTIIRKLRRYRNKGLMMYLLPEIMDALSDATDFTRNIEVTVIVQGGQAIETRITSLDGVPLVEVIDSDRFYTAFDFTEGFEPGTGAYQINVLAATPQTTVFVPKIASIFFFEPGGHTSGDGYLYQNRAFWDTFSFPNGKDGKIDSIFVDRNTTAV